MFVFKTHGTCAREIHIDTDGNLIKKVDFVGGCPGNLLGISKIVEGMEIDTVIDRFQATTCGNKSTSCPDQLALALKELQSK